MQRAIALPCTLLIGASMVSGACAHDGVVAGAAPLTNSPAARQTANSSSADLADASVELSPTKGSTANGQLTFMAEGDGVHVMGTILGLAPNSSHGIHIHENGDCSTANASSAGGHFNPLAKRHGAPGSEAHLGDLGNVTANHAGVAYVDVRVPQATLGDGESTNILAKAVIVHGRADDLKSQPSGDAGARIACGVIAPTPTPSNP